MSTLVNPHGESQLNPLLLPATECPDVLKHAGTLKKVPLSSRELSDLLMLAMGAYTPLTGFMGEEDWRGCCVDMATSDGVFWPIPITLSATQDLADSLKLGEEVALVNDSGKIFGVMEVRDKYGIDKDLECSNIYRTTDAAHPGVQKVMEQGPVNLAGPVKVIDEDHYPKT